MPDDTCQPASLGLRVGDARLADSILSEAAAKLFPEDQSEPFLTATITSPPYGNLVDYDMPNQIGFGQSWEQYVEDCGRLFKTLYKWTREDGSLWLVADSFVDPVGKNSAGPLRMLPFELAEVAKPIGWTLREVVIWHKDRTLPWSGRGRMRNSFEYVLLLVKTSSYKYYLDRLRDQTDLGRWWVRYPERYNPAGIAPDNVWDIPIPLQGSWQRSLPRHACPFPPDLVRRILLLSSDEGDVIFDPFAGSGTTVAVADALKRRGLGIELNSKYVDEYARFLRPYVASRWLSAEAESSSAVMTNRIWQLRAVKYPKVALKRLQDLYPDLPVPSLCAVFIGDPAHGEFATPTLTVELAFLLEGVSDTVKAEVCLALKTVMQRAPLSKFGISGAVYVVGEAEFTRLGQRQKWYLYEHGHTWHTSGQVSLEDALSVDESPSAGHHKPIIANVDLAIRFPEND